MVLAVRTRSSPSSEYVLPVSRFFANRRTLPLKDAVSARTRASSAKESFAWPNALGANNKTTNASGMIALEHVIFIICSNLDSIQRLASLSRGATTSLAPRSAFQENASGNRDQIAAAGGFGTVSVRLILYADTVRQRCFAILRDWHLELCGKGRSLFSFESRRDHFPIAANRFIHNDRDRAVLVIANLDLVSIFVHVAGDDYSVVRLFSFSHDVERIANFDAHVFIFRRVIDFVFADELLIALVILFVESNRARRQRHTQLVRLRVAELNVHPDLLFDRRPRIVVAGVVITLAVQHELFLHIKAGCFKQRDLFRLVVANCGRALQRVHVIFEEPLLLKLRNAVCFLS